MLHGEDLHRDDDEEDRLGHWAAGIPPLGVRHKGGSKGEHMAPYAIEEVVPRCNFVA